jgi:hypothetical protein
VLARLEGVERLPGVPVVRRGNADGVDRVVGEQVAVVGEDFRVARWTAQRPPMPMNPTRSRLFGAAAGAPPAERTATPAAATPASAVACSMNCRRETPAAVEELGEELM